MTGHSSQPRENETCKETARPLAIKLTHFVPLADADFLVLDQLTQTDLLLDAHRTSSSRARCRTRCLC